MGKSRIEWTDETWNPTTGCTKVSQGCKHCYAERVFPRPYPGRAFTDVRCHPERLDQPLRWRKPRRVFVDSMSDLFHEDVPDDFILKVFDVMRSCTTAASSAWPNQHIFQILTKRPARMQDLMKRMRFNGGSGDGEMWFAKDHSDRRGWGVMGGYPGCYPLPNVWLGVSVEDQATADERIPLLLQTPAAVRFLSCEPLLGPMDIRTYLGRYCPHCQRFGEPGEQCRRCGEVTFYSDRGVDWLIVGGESGPNARPMHPDWPRSLRDQCEAAGVPFFFKQWGEWLPFDEDGEPPKSHSRNWYLMYDDGVVDIPDYRWPHSEDGEVGIARVGKKAADRTLDGRTHDEFPEVHYG